MPAALLAVVCCYMHYNYIAYSKFMSTVVKSGNTIAVVCLCIASRILAIDEQETES